MSISPVRIATAAAAVAVCAASLGLPAVAAGAPSRAPAPAAGGIIVRFAGGTAGAERAAARSRAGVRLERSLRSGSQLVRPRAGETPRRALARLREDPRVRFAEVDAVMRASGLTDDPMLRDGRLWGLQNTPASTALFGGSVDADVDAPEAWEIGQGEGALVAVVDTGVAAGHPDLAPRMWVNPGEVAGNGLDDDGNGYVDDRTGYNTVDRTPDTTDRDGHGTHVAGTVAAAGNDGAGIVGVAWRARVMPVKVLDDQGYGTNSSVAEGFRYAAENGADVVNASLGGSGHSVEIADAIADHPGVLFVVAAGNGGDDGVGDDNDQGGGEYPCTDPAPNVVCVAATDAGDRLTSFSNYGSTSVDLAAPGQSILSAALSQVLLADDFEDGVLADTWGVSGWAWDADEYGGFARSQGPAGGTLTSTGALSLAGRTGCRLDWWSSQSGPTDAYVDVSIDGSTFTARDGLGSGGWSARSLTLASDVVAVRFRLAAEASSDFLFVDDVSLTCEGFDAQTSFAYLSGTSMATPHVAGAAALLVAALAAPTPARVREALLRSGDRLPALAGRTASGRRLNANAALRYWEAFTAATGGPLEVTATAARLTGEVGAGQVPTDWYFEYGQTTAYGTTTAVATTDGVPSAAVGQALTGLAASTTYHYRLVARRGARLVTGSDRTFTTAAPADDPAADGGAGAVSPATVADPPPEPPAADPPPEPPAADPVAAMRESATLRCRARGRRRLICRFGAAGAERVRASVRDRRGRTLGRARGRADRRLRIRTRRLRGRRVVVQVRFFDAAGRRATIRRTLRVR